MSQLDKTFPTNDCSMCIESPKFIECDRHPNIEILTYTEVDSVEGEAGRLQGHADQEAALHHRGQVHRLHDLRRVLPGQDSRSVQSEPVAEQGGPHLLLAGGAARHLHRRQLPLPQGQDLHDLRRASARTTPSTSTRSRRRSRSRSARSSCRPGYDVVRSASCGATTATARSRTSSPASTSSGCSAPPGRTRARSCVRPTRSIRTRSPGSTASARARSIPGGNTYCSAVCCSYTQKQVILAKDHDADLRGDDLPQRHPLLRQGLRALLPARGEAARRASSSAATSRSAGRIPETKNVTHPLRHRRRRREGGGIRPGRAVGRAEPARRMRKDLARKFGIELERARLLQDQPGQSDRDHPPGHLHQRRLPGSAGHSRVGGDRERRRRAVGAAARSPGAASWPRSGSIRRSGTSRKRRPRSASSSAVAAPTSAAWSTCRRVVEYSRTLDNVVHAEESLFACSTDTAKADRGHDPRQGAQPRGRRGLHAAHARAAVPRHAAGSRHQPVLLRHGEHPRALLLGPLQGEGRRHRRRPRTSSACRWRAPRMLEPLEEFELPVNKAALVVGGGVAGMTSALTLAEQGFEIYLVEKDVRPGRHGAPASTTRSKASTCRPTSPI